MNLNQETMLKNVLKSVLSSLFVRLNSNFHPLTFTKLRFWPPKKTTKPPPSFATVAPHLGCHISVDRVKIDLWVQNCHRCKT